MRNFFEKIRDIVPISNIVNQKVHLVRKGVEYIGLCPFHNENTPSFTVNDIKKFFHCFGCGAHGDLIKFVSETRGFSYKEAALFIASEFNIEIPKLSKEEEREFSESEEIYRILSIATDFFKSNLNQESIKYLETRGITQNMIEKFKIGYAPNNNSIIQYLEDKKIPLMMIHKAGIVGKNEKGLFFSIFRDRIMFPIINIYGKTIAFGGRTIKNAIPKYINSPETLVFKKNETLYGLNNALTKTFRDSRIIVLEGYMDVISMYTNGFINSVACLGTAITKNHLMKIWKICNEIIICMDSDKAGVNASMKILDIGLKEITPEKQISFVLIPEFYGDPDDLLKKYGASYMDNFIAKRITTSEMIWLKCISEISTKTAEQKSLLESKLEAYLNLIENSVLRSNFRSYFKDQLWRFFNKKSGAREMQTLPLEKVDEIYLIECALVNFIIHHPESLSDTLVYELITTSKLSNLMLQNLLDFIISLIANHNISTNIELLEALKNSEYYDALQTIQNNNQFKFVNALNIAPKQDNTLLFNILYHKYSLAKLIKESENLNTKTTDYIDNIEKIQFYKSNILELNNKINNLIEELTQEE